MKLKLRATVPAKTSRTAQRCFITIIMIMIITITMTIIIAITMSTILIITMIIIIMIIIAAWEAAQCT